MRALGLDLGEKRIGVAISDAAGTVATPYETVVRSGDPAADHRRIADLATEAGVEVLVVGHPRSLDGRRGPAARTAEAEAEALAAATGLPVELHDERLTTAEAERALVGAGIRSRRRRQVIDQTAAAVILQGWLDSR